MIRTVQSRVHAILTLLGEVTANRLIAVIAFVCFVCTLASATRAASPLAVVAGALPKLTISASVVSGLPRRRIAVTDENGQSTAYEGVDLGALLAKNGASQGAALRGAAVADYVLVEATDDYRVVFALAELDPALTAKVVLLADERNGAPLPADVGPFQIIVPDEKHHVRWVRNVREIDVLAAPYGI